MNPNEQQFPHSLYAVSSPTDKTVLIALDVTRQGNMITWFDSVRYRLLEVAEIVEERPDIFVFKNKRGQTYTLVPMTLEIYEKKVRPWLVAPEDVQSMEDLTDKFQQTKKFAW